MILHHFVLFLYSENTRREERAAFGIVGRTFPSCSLVEAETAIRLDNCSTLRAPE